MLKARTFGGVLLVAAEEARSSTDGEHAQVPSRTDAASTRPAFPGWPEQQFPTGAR
jgi:hypothetical protein